MLLRSLISSNIILYNDNIKWINLLYNTRVSQNTLVIRIIKFTLSIPMCDSNLEEVVATRFQSNRGSATSVVYGIRI